MEKTATITPQFYYWVGRWKYEKELHLMQDEVNTLAKHEWMFNTGVSQVITLEGKELRVLADLKQKKGWKAMKEEFPYIEWQPRENMSVDGWLRGYNKKGDHEGLFVKYLYNEEIKDDTSTWKISRCTAGKVDYSGVVTIQDLPASRKRRWAHIFEEMEKEFMDDLILDKYPKIE